MSCLLGLRNDLIPVVAVVVVLEVKIRLLTG